MGDFTYRIIKEANLSKETRDKLNNLTDSCFSQVSPSEKQECFYAKINARVYALYEKDIIGCVLIHIREVIFDGTQIKIGGAVGACVTEKMRQKGVAERMMRLGLNYLKHEGCDIACLIVDRENQTNAIKLYQKLGFVPLNREISFEEVYGQIKYDTGAMFLPLASKEIFNRILHSKQIFHYGRGYW